jgi:hypothetical protein
MGTHVGITHLGGRGWLLPVEEVARAIGAQERRFFIVRGGRRYELGLITGALGSYVRARDGDGWTDDLLTLPDCRGG